MSTATIPTMTEREAKERAILKSRSAAVYASCTTIQSVEFSTDFYETGKPAAAVSADSIADDITGSVRHADGFMYAFTVDGFAVIGASAAVITLNREKRAEKTRAKILQAAEKRGLNTRPTLMPDGLKKYSETIRDKMTFCRGPKFSEIAYDRHGDCLLWNWEGSRRVNETIVSGRYHSAVLYYHPKARPEFTGPENPVSYSDEFGNVVAIVMPMEITKRDYQICLRTSALTWEDVSRPGARSVFVDIAKPQKKATGGTATICTFRVQDVDGNNLPETAEMTIERHNGETWIFYNYGARRINYHVLGKAPGDKTAVEIVQRIARKACDIRNGALVFSP